MSSRTKLLQLRDEIRADLASANKLSVERIRAEYEAGQLLLEVVGVGRPRKGHTRDLLLKELDIRKQEAHRWRMLAWIPPEVFESELQRMASRSTAAARAGHEFSRAALLRLARTSYRPIPRSTTNKASKDCVLRVADIRRGLPFLDDGSVACIVTDPPYQADAIDLFGALAQTAKRVTKPGAFIAVVLGNQFVDHQLAALSEHLHFVLLLNYVFPRTVKLWGADQCVHIVRSKPVVVLSNGAPLRGLRDNTVHAEQVSDSTWHAHGQCEVGMRRLVELISQPGETVLDPFVGGGSIAAGSVATGRSFIGCDIDRKAIATTRRRIAVP